VKLANALIQEKTVKEAAEAAGISERTAHRRMKSPDFQSLVDQHSIKVLMHGIYRFLLGFPLAVETLVNLLNDDSPSIRRMASQAVIDYTHKFTDSILFASRMEELAGRVDELLQIRKG
jgi:hypothetical protein